MVLFAPPPPYCGREDILEAVGIKVMRGFGRPGALELIFICGLKKPNVIVIERGFGRPGAKIVILST